MRMGKLSSIEPDNFWHLNDLGYSPLEVGEFDAAAEVLRRAVHLEDAATER